jgi:hypothetical protein
MQVKSSARQVSSVPNDTLPGCGVLLYTFWWKFGLCLIQWPNLEKFRARSVTAPKLRTACGLTSTRLSGSTRRRRTKRSRRMTWRVRWTNPPTGLRNPRSRDESFEQEGGGNDELDNYLRLTQRHRQVGCPRMTGLGKAPCPGLLGPDDP